MIAKIAENIISNFDYDEAIEFIRKYGSKATAASLASLAPSSFAESKFIREIRRIAESTPKEIIRSSDPIPTDQSPDLDRIIELKNEKVRKRDHLRGQLELVPNDQDRLELAIEIIKLTHNIASDWKDIHTLKSGSDLPRSEPTDDIDEVFAGVSNPLQIEKIRKNYVSYRSKAKKGQRPKEKLEFYNKVIAEAERRLGEYAV